MRVANNGYEKENIQSCTEQRISRYKANKIGCHAKRNKFLYFLTELSESLFLFRIRRRHNSAGYIRGEVGWMDYLNTGGPMLFHILLSFLSSFLIEYFFSTCITHFPIKSLKVWSRLGLANVAINLRGIIFLKKRAFHILCLHCACVVGLQYYFNYWWCVYFSSK